MDEQRPEMTLEVFRLLPAMVHERCGSLIRGALKVVMAPRPSPRLEVLGFSDFGAYHRYLRYDPSRKAELEAAIEALTTNETYFFREPLQLRAFTEELLPVLHRRNLRQRRLRIWSAGCSTGEEPYTV